MTFPLELILVYVLLFQDGISGRDFLVYHRRGQEAILLCGDAIPPDTTCPYITWLYTTSSNKLFPVVKNEKVLSNSPQAARLSVDRECSLVIQSVTAEDVGVYTCRCGSDDERSFLNVLTISPAPPDAGPKSDGEVTLKCSLRMYTDAVPCRQSSIRWLDETRSVLRREGVGDSFLQETDCVSVLKVKHQSGHSNRYTCQFVDETQVKTEADYTPDFTGGKTETSDPGWSPLSAVMLALRIVALILVTVTTFVVIRHKWNKKRLDNNIEIFNVSGSVLYENGGSVLYENGGSVLYENGGSVLYENDGSIRFENDGSVRYENGGVLHATATRH